MSLCFYTPLEEKHIGYNVIIKACFPHGGSDSLLAFSFP